MNNYYKYLLVSIICLFVSITTISFNSCDDSPTEPENKPGSRNYTWSADTLKIPYGEFANPISIWGEEPTNLWVTGSGSSNQYRLFEYNEEEWKNFNVNFSINGAWGIHGLDRNSVWLCTSQGQIAKYDGLNWKSSGDFSPENETLKLLGFAGQNLDNLYAFGYLNKNNNTGYKACVLKYHNTKTPWRFVEIGDIEVSFTSMDYDIENNIFFISGYRFVDGMQIIYKFSNGGIEKLFESREETKVLAMGNEVYFMVGKVIYKYEKNGLVKWKDFIDIEGFAGPIIGNSEKNIFTATFGKGIGHYDGNNIEILYKTDLWFLDSILFDRDVFFLCFNPETKVAVMIHGKLK